MTEVVRAADAEAALSASPTAPVVAALSGNDQPREEERFWMKEPCGPCPYSRSKTLVLHPERAEDFAYNASNPYNDFPCHKTAVVVDDDEDGSEFVAGPRSLTCNGFLSLQCRENDKTIPGFPPHEDAFEDAWEMTERHAELWEEQQWQSRRFAQGMAAAPADETGTGSAVGNSPVAESDAPTPSSPKAGAQTTPPPSSHKHQEQVN